MSSLLSRAFSRRPSFPRLSCIALLVAGIGLAGCGGDDDNPPVVKQADQVGTLHGALAAALQEELGIGAPLTNLATPVDALQDIVILSDPNGIHDAHPALPLMKNAFYAGRAVVLENVNAKEVHALIKALGVRISGFTPPNGAEFVELFAVRKVKNDTWFFVDAGANWEPSAGDDFNSDWDHLDWFHFDKTESYDSCGLPGDEQQQVKIRVCGNAGPPSGSADGAEGVRQQAQQCEAAKQALGAPRALSPTLAKAIRANTTPVEETGVDPDCNGRNPNSVCGPMRSRALLDWAQRGREEAAKPPQSVVLQNAGDTTPEFDPAATMKWEVSETPGGRQFRLVFEMTAYHSFKEDADYYYISQTGDFSPGDARRNEPAVCSFSSSADPGYQEGYIRFYEFESALQDWVGGPYDHGFDSSETVDYRHSPENQGTNYSVSISTEKDLSGSVGFSAGYSKASSASDANPSAGGPEGSVSGSLGVGIHKSISESRVYDEAAMTFTYRGRLGKAINGSSAPKQGGLNWRYDLLRPCNGNECNILHVWYLANLQNATNLAINTFSPHHEWVWRVPSKYSRIYFEDPGTYNKEEPYGFETYFRAVTGKSLGYFNDMHVAVWPTQHVCDQRFDLWFWVPVSRPPLLVVDQSGLKEFPAQGGYQTLNLASEYYWKVYEKPDWVTVEPMFGGPTSKDKSSTKRKKWDGSADLQVTVYKDKDFDEGSKNRSGTVKICATESLDGDCFPEKDMIYIDGVERWIEEREEVWFDVTQVPF